MADQSDRNCVVLARQGMTRKPYQSSQYDISLRGCKARWFPDNRQTTETTQRCGFLEVDRNGRSSGTIVAFTRQDDTLRYAQLQVGETWERTQDLQTSAESHKVNGPFIFVRSHKTAKKTQGNSPAPVPANEVEC